MVLSVQLMIGLMAVTAMVLWASAHALSSKQATAKITTTTKTKKQTTTI